MGLQQSIYNFFTNFSDVPRANTPEEFEAAQVKLREEKRVKELEKSRESMKLKYAASGNENFKKGPFDQSLANMQEYMLAYGTTFEEAYETLEHNDIPFEAYEGRQTKLLEQAEQSEEWDPELSNMVWESFGLSKDRIAETEENRSNSQIFRSGAALYAKLSGDKKDEQYNLDKAKQIGKDETFWKYYSAEEDAESDTGLNVPWNVKGAIYDTVPALAIGGAASMARTGFGQMMVDVTGNLALTGLNYNVDRDKGSLAVSSAVDVATSVLPIKGFNFLKKGPEGSFVDLGNNDIYNIMQQQKSLVNGDLFSTYRLANNAGQVEGFLKTVKNPNYINQVIKSQQQSANVFLGTVDKSLAKLGKTRIELRDGLGPREQQWGDNPSSYEVFKEIKQNKDALIGQANKFKDTYTKLGKDIKIDTSDLLRFAETESDKAAYNHLKSIYNNVKRVGNTGEDMLKNADHLASLKKSDSSMLEKLKNNRESQGLAGQKRSTASRELEEMPFTEGSNLTEAQSKANIKYEKKQNEIQGYTNSIGKLERQKSTYTESLNASKYERIMLDRKIEEDSAVEILNLGSLDANTLDEIIRQLQKDMYQNASAFQGKLDPSSMDRLVKWIGTAQDKLVEETPPEFSLPYTKAKELYTNSFALSGHSVKDRNAPITGLGNAYSMYTDFGDAGEFKQLFDSPENLNSLYSVIDRDSAAYSQMYRHHIEQQLPIYRNPIGATETAVDYQSYANGLRDVDFEYLMGGQSDPVKQQALEALAGTQSFAYQQAQNPITANLKNLIDYRDGLNPGMFSQYAYGASDVTRQFRELKYDVLDEYAPKLKGLVQPWYKDTNMNVSDQVYGLMNKFKAVDDKEVLYQGPLKTAKIYEELYDIKKLTESPKIREFKQPLLEKIGHPDYISKDLTTDVTPQVNPGVIDVKEVNTIQGVE